MKETTRTFPRLVECGNDLTMYAAACATWHTQFEKELKERLNRLEKVRAGGLDNHFETGEKFMLKAVLGIDNAKELDQAVEWRNAIIRQGLQSVNNKESVKKQ